MRRLAPLLSAPVLVAMPLCIDGSWPVVLAATLSGAACLVAARRPSLRYATVAGVLALLAMALALRAASSSSHLLPAGLFGVALLYLVDATHLAARFDGAEIAPTWWRRHVAWWSARAALSIAALVLIAIAAPLIALATPPVWSPFLTGLGVLAIVAAAFAFAWPRVDK